MNKLLASSSAVASAILFLLAGLHVSALSQAHAMTPLGESGNIGVVPKPADVQLADLPQTDVQITPDQALSAANKVFGITSPEVDPTAGIVRADVSRIGDTLHQHERALVVVADRRVAVSQSHIVFQKLCVVVDARSGQYLWAFAADPVKSS